MHGAMTKVAVTQDRVAVIGSVGSRTIQFAAINNAVSPTVIGGAGIWSASQSRRVAVKGDLAFVAKHNAGLKVLDVSNPSIPQEIGSLSFDVFVYCVATADSVVYAGTDSKLWAIDVSNPQLPSALGSCELPARAYDIVLYGDYVLATTQGEGMRVIDVSDPTNLVEVGHTSPSTEFGVAVWSDHAFTTTGASMKVIDLTDPTNPTVVATVDPPPYLARAVVQDDIAYVSASTGVVVYDVSTPNSPQLLGEVALPKSAGEAYLVDDVLYVACGQGGVQVVDVTNPSTPQLLGGLYIQDSAFDVVPTGEALVVAAGEYGIYTIPLQCGGVLPLQVYPGDTDNNGNVDILDLLPLGLHFLHQGPTRESGNLIWSAQPATAWTNPPETYADTDGNGVVNEQDLFAIGLNWGQTHDQGSSAFEIDPGDPVLVSQNRKAFFTLYQSLSGSSETTLAMKTLLAEMLDLESPAFPSRFVVFQNHPNPFNPLTTIRFDLPMAGLVTLQIFDVRGELVKIVIKDRPYDPGNHSVTVSTEQLSSGVYFYRLKTSQSEAVRKMTVIK